VDQVFYLQGFFGNPFNIPIAGLMFYIGATPPNANFAFPVGQAIARITYAPLYSLVGNTYGGGDGSTTFNLPDLRGMVIAGLDGMGGSGITTRISIAGGNFDATVLGASGGSQSRTILNGHLPASIPYSDPGHGHPGSTVGLAQNNSVTSGSANAVQVTGSSNLSINPATIGITINPGGANTPLPILQPTMVLPYILRII
jgi:microcystin-dependent protein